jgi:hypothetical protein
VIVDLQSELYGAETNLVYNLLRCDCISIDLLGGFRYLSLQENMQINDATIVGPAGVGFFQGNVFGQGAGLTSTDLFETENRFYGGQFGAKMELRFGSWYILSKAKIALGATNQEIDISGNSGLSISDLLVSTAPGGKLALPSNIGNHSRTEFGAVPEVDLTIGWQVTKGWRIYAGYSWLYWTDVVRPAEQTDRVVNPGLVPTSAMFGTAGPNRPAAQLRGTEFWVHGIHGGLAFRF